MIDFILFHSSYITTGLSAFMGYILFMTVYYMIGKEDRTYMDPLSWKLKLIWPFIQIIANFFVVFLPYEMIESTDKKLQRTGVGYLMTAEQYIALKVFVAILAPIFAWILMAGMGNFQPAWLIIAPILG